MDAGSRVRLGALALGFAVAVGGLAPVASAVPSKERTPPALRCGKDQALLSHDALIKSSAWDDPGRPKTARAALARELAHATGDMARLRNLRFERWTTGQGAVIFVGFGKKGNPRGSVSVLQGGKSKSWLTESASVCVRSPEGP